MATTEALDLTAEFDLRGCAYLDGAAHGPLPRCSLAAATRALDWKRDPTRIDDRLYFELPDRIRRAAAPLFGCAAEDIALATGASHGISLVSQGLDWRASDRVVIPEGEFPANSLPWMALRARGVRVDVVAPERLLETIAPDVRAVAVGHVNFARGRRLDLRAIGARAAECEAIFVVDLSQSLGAVPVDVRACRATVAAVAGYKWLLSPYGTGLTYVHPDWVERLPVPTFNWSTIAGSDDFNRLVELVPRFRPGAVRFDVPETAAFVHGAAMAESLELLGTVGVEAGWRHACALLDRLVADLPPGFRVDSRLEEAERSTILRLVGRDERATRAAYEAVRAADATVSLREGGIRVSPGIWSGTKDIDRLLEVLSRA